MTRFPPFTPLRVLVVDDSADTRDTLQVLLQIWGHEVRTAGDAVEALAAAQAFAPQVVLLDISLPQTDGFQVARELRRLPQLAETTVVAVTGYGQESSGVEFREKGFDHYMVKPLDLTALEELLASPLGTARA
jgi:CheY-like chemotaxis protein